MPRLWLKPKGINDSIDVKTADFIMDTAVYCSAHGIVPERFDLKGRKHGPKKQCLHYRRVQCVQRRGGRQGSPQRAAGESGQRREYVETRV